MLPGQWAYCRKTAIRRMALNKLTSLYFSIYL